MLHSKAVDLMDPAEVLGASVAAVRSDVAALSTSHSGTSAWSNPDGSLTVMGPAAGDQTMATHVGDTTPPPVPTGIAATSVDGTVAVTWDGTLAGDVPADFLRVNLYIDGMWFAALAEAGSALTPPQAVGSTVEVTATSEDDACEWDGTPAHNVSAHCAPVAVEVRDLFAEGRAEMDEARADLDAFKGDAATTYATKASLTTTADSIRSEVSRDYATKAATATLAEKSYVDQRADSITSTVEQTYVTKDAAKAYATKTEVKQTTDAIRLTADSALAKVDGLDVGGTNLLPNSGEFRADYPDAGFRWSRNGATSVEVATEDGRTVLKADGSVRQVGYVLLEPSAEYLWHGVIKCSADMAANTSWPFHHWVKTYAGGSPTQSTGNDFGAKGWSAYVEYGGGRHPSGTTVPAGTWAHVVVSFKTVAKTEAFDEVRFYPFVYGGAVNSNPWTLMWLKLERGNVATDWSPCPSDIASTYATKAALSVESDRITGVVTEQAGLAGRVSTVEQKADGLTVTLGEVADDASSALTAAEAAADMAQSAATNSADAIAQTNAAVAANTSILDSFSVDELNQVLARVRVVQAGGVPALQLGSTTSGLWAQLTNSQLSFMDASTVVAYISAMKLFISQAQVTGQLGIGGFAWVPRSNGNLCLKKV